MQIEPPSWIRWIVENPPVFLVFFVCVLALTLHVIGIVSGWAALAKRFRDKEPFYGEKWPFQSARMRFYSHYGNCLSVGSDESGLYLAVFPIFRIGHPPLLIPWSEIAVVSSERGLIFKFRELRLGRDESIPLRISKSLFETLRRSAGREWPHETVAV